MKKYRNKSFDDYLNCLENYLTWIVLYINENEQTKFQGNDG